MEDYDEAFKLRVEALFHGKLADIEAAGRDPSPFEATCFVDAISLMASNSWSLAERRLTLSHQLTLSRKRSQPPHSLTGVTVKSLRVAWGESRAYFQRMR
jgi:hypothetical protein